MSRQGGACSEVSASVLFCVLFWSEERTLFYDKVVA
jgi:hypothetical protein